MILSRVPDTQPLNTLKKRLCEVTTLLDATTIVYLPLLEAHQVKHEVVVLLRELRIHGLLPETVILKESEA